MARSGFTREIVICEVPPTTTWSGANVFDTIGAAKTAPGATVNVMFALEPALAFALRIDPVALVALPTAVPTTLTTRLQLPFAGMTPLDKIVELAFGDASIEPPQLLAL